MMETLERARFRLVVRDTFALKTPGVVVVGVVEGSSISVGDSVQLRRYDEESPKARVDALEIGFGQRADTAEPGTHVGILLRGIRKEQITKGDILEKPWENSRFIKTIRTFDIIIAIIAIVVVANLLFGGVSLLFGWQDERQEILRQTISIALANIAIFTGIIACEGLANRAWRRRNQREDWDAGFQVLKCSPSAYALPVCGVLLLLMTALLLRNATAEELHTAWDEGTLTFPLLFVVGFNILAAAFFLYYTRQKVFYSRYKLRLVSFWRRYDIPWARIQTITFSRKKKKSRLTVTAAEKTIILRSDILSDGWDDFVGWARRMAEDYRIPFGEKR